MKVLVTFLKKVIPLRLNVFIKRKILKRHIPSDILSHRPSRLVNYEGLLFNLHSNSYIENLIIEYGDFESHIVMLSKNLISKKDVVLDVGANVGLHTLLFSKLVGEEGKVFAFEPNKLNFERLNLNLSLNSISNTKIVSSAVSDEIGEKIFYEFSNNSENLGNHSFAYTETIKRLEKEELVSKRRVLCTTIDDYCKKNDISPNFIKMDIEGFEYNALKGARNSLQSKELKGLIIEFNSARIQSIGLQNSSFEEILKEYDCYEILRPTPSNPYTSLSPYNFDRDITSDLLCLKQISIENP